MQGGHCPIETKAPTKGPGASMEKTHLIDAASPSIGQKFLFVEHAIEKTRLALKRYGD